MLSLHSYHWIMQRISLLSFFTAQKESVHSVRNSSQAQTYVGYSSRAKFMETETLDETSEVELGRKRL